MSAPIRPVKLEPVPQSRGSEPAIASSSEAPLFGAILDFHLEEEGEEIEESPKAEEPEGAPWTLLGVGPGAVSPVESELEITAPVRPLMGAAVELCPLDKPQLGEVRLEEAPGLDSVIQKLSPGTERQQISSPRPANRKKLPD